MRKFNSMAHIIERDTHAGTIRRTNEFAIDPDFNTRLIRVIRTRINLLHQAWQEFKSAHVLVMQGLGDGENSEPHTREFAEMEELFINADSIMQERVIEVDRSILVDENGQNDDDNDVDGENANNHQEQDNVPPPLTNQQNHTAQNAQANAGGMGPNVQVGQYPAAVQQFGQMPWQFRIENIWGEFDGNKEQWQSFHDSFKANVYDDPLLPPVRKFQILRAALKGKAAKALGQWQVCDRNFEPAWQRLKKLFDDPYGTSKQLLQKILSLDKVESPNGYKLQIISNVAQEVSRQLMTVGLPAEHYDLMFIHAVQAKLDQKTSMDWDDHRGDNIQPSLNEFTDFLDARAKALSNAYQSEHGNESHKNKERKRPSNGKFYQSDNKRAKPNTSSTNYTVAKQEKQNCAACSGEHLTRKCEKFLKLNLQKRKEKAREANLCFNCLGRGHTIKDCKAGNCNRCEKKHNSLLCPENPNNRQLVANQVAKHKGRRNQKKPTDKPQ